MRRTCTRTHRSISLPSGHATVVAAPFCTGADEQGDQQFYSSSLGVYAL